MKINNFFDEIIQNIPKKEIKFIIVTHILPDKYLFLKYLSKIGDIRGIIPKQTSIDKTSLKIIKKDFTVFHNITKEYLKNKRKTIKFIKSLVGNNKFIILDIGGYFSYSINDINEEFGNNFLGIIEDTENGHIKYERIKNVKSPIFSVARSPLKYSEDILVAYSTVYSAENILRFRNETLVSKKITVIGYGKIGEHIVRDLTAKKARVFVYDNDPKKLIHALAEGYNIINKKELLKSSDIIFCVTGNKSLNEFDLNKIKKECYIFSITSSDDEFKFNKFKNFVKEKFDPVGFTLIKGECKIHLVNYGNSINFLHKAVIGNFIYLVQSEIILAINELISKKYSSGISELEDSKRNKIAKIWLKIFQNENN